MAHDRSIADHWEVNDLYARILSALEKSSKNLDALTVEDLAPIDHFHARGFPATVELGDRLPIEPGHHVLDIGCGLGGPARYFAQRFGCRVSGVDITPSFVEGAERLTALLRLEDRVAVRLGDGQHLDFEDATFDGAYAQHVTMNVPDRPRFFAEAHRVLKPGAFFALTEHGLGAAGAPYYPLPWSEDGSGAYLATPEETCAFLEAAGFTELDLAHTGAEYLESYKKRIAMAEQGALPPLGVHLLMGRTAPQKLRNAARNIEEHRTHPVRILCRKPR